MIKKYKNINIFIDDEIVVDAKINFPSTIKHVIAPYYTVDGELDDSGNERIYLLMSSANTTLTSLKEVAIKETNRRKI